MLHKTLSLLLACVWPMQHHLPSGALAQERKSSTLQLRKKCPSPSVAVEHM